MLLYPYNKERFTIRSIAIFLKRSVLESMVIRKRDDLGLVVTAFVAWHMA